MTQPAAEQLLNLADRAEKGLTPDEAQRLRESISQLYDLFERYRDRSNEYADRYLKQRARAEQAEAERDQLARDADRLFKHSVEVLGRAERAEAAIERVRAIHTHGPRTNTCNDCGQPWPCEVTRALDEQQEQP